MNIHPSCIEEKCGICFRKGLDVQATHKVGEEIQQEQNRHNLTQYICCQHFKEIMGNFADTICKNEH